MPTQLSNTFAFAMWSQIQEVTFGEMQQHDIMMYHSWHGVTYTPLQSVSVNVMTLKYGFDSAIFFNHSLHAPHGFSGLMS